MRVRKRSAKELELDREIEWKLSVVEITKKKLGIGDNPTGIRLLSQITGVAEATLRDLLLRGQNNIRISEKGKILKQMMRDRV